MKYRIVLAFLMSLLIPFISLGQEVEMADGMRANGKIYIVIVVLSVVLAGIFLFLMSIDYRLRKIEKNAGKAHK